jgi:hypothetical protein
MAREAISRLLRKAADETGQRGNSVVGGSALPSRAAVYEVRQVSRDARGRRIVERWTEPVR